MGEGRSEDSEAVASDNTPHRWRDRVSPVGKNVTAKLSGSRQA